MLALGADTFGVNVNRVTEGRRSSTSVRRVARNSVVRAVAEIIGKVATFAMFVAIARKLGPRGFGDITFALALTGQLLLLFGFGVDTVLAREASRRPSLLGGLMGNALTLKAIALLPALLITAAVLQLGSYSSEVQIATSLIFLSTAVDVLENAWNAAFQAHERLEFVSALVVFQRLVTGGLVVAVLSAGAGIVAISGVYFVVSVATILLAMWLLRFVASPRWTFDRRKLLPLFRSGFPVGVVILLFTLLLRIDTVLLSLLTNNKEVGIYAAAFRLFEATMFVSWAFSGSLFPWMARKHVESHAQLARGYEAGLVVMLSLLTPIGVAYACLAQPIIHLVYGTNFDAAILPLRLMGLVVVAFGVNSFTSTTLAAHDRPSLMHKALAVVAIQNIAMNVVLIPPYGATGAAISAAVSGLLLGTLSIRQATVALSHVRLLRAAAGPAAGAVAMACAILAFDGPLFVEFAVGGVTYAVVGLIVERAVFPDELSAVFASLRIRTKNA